ncbi:MAG: ribosome silencing factor [Clostridiales Family XIII bacterium]|nr:ribosome silencing factor [Clostridiales Family XIII bacterium]
MSNIDRTNREIAALIGETISAKKGLSVILIDISEKSSFADFFVVATATNERQLASFADEVEGALEPDGIFVKNIEGKPSSGWILMDYGDVVVNLFLEETRGLYNLEKIWRDGEITEIE